MREVAGAEAATIVPWDATASAAAVAPLLVPGPTRDAHLALLSRALDRWRWELIVPELIEAYRTALHSPYRAAAPRAHEELQREELLADVHAAYMDLLDRVRHGLSLIDRGGLLSDAEQRGLMRIASRPLLRTPLLGPIGWLGGLRRREPPSKP
jgi:hypothetical protein